MSTVTKECQNSFSEPIEEVNNSIDEGLLRKAINERWPSQEGWFLKLVPLWGKENCFRYRANWYSGSVVGKIMQTRFIHVNVADDGSRLWRL